MENATKALLIAGAVAVTLLILSLGMYFYNTATEGVNLDKLSQAQKDEFNSGFTMYEGTAVSGTQVNQLIQKVITSNAKEVADTSGKYITLKVDGTSFSAVEETNSGTTVKNAQNTKVKSGFTYDVKVTEERNDKQGLIDTITITTNGK